MKIPLKLFLLLLVALGLTACEKTPDQGKKAREDADAKARADAAKKEMSTLPKVFSTPDYLKKNDPAKTNTTTQPATDPAKK